MEPQVRYRYSKVRVTLVAVAFLAILAGLAYGGYEVYERLQPVSAADKERVISELGEIVDLPQDEEPSIATVSDLEQLKGQAFFIDAKIGDIVLVYNQASKAYLYRPSTDKLINIASLLQ